MILHASHQLSISAFREAESILRETLEFADALGQSNMGLVSAILQSLLARGVSDLLADNLLRLRDPAMLRNYADLLSDHLVDQECLLNSLRQEYYQLDAIIRQTAETAYENWRRLSDSTGFHFPGYTWRKILDPRDSHEIHQYQWAKTIEAAAHPTRDADSQPPGFLLDPERHPVQRRFPSLQRRIFDGDPLMA